MQVGIVSDTHDDMGAIARVVELFNSRGVSRVLHAGDLVSPFTFEVLEGLKCGLTGIFGNNDGDRVLLRERSGGNIHIQPHVLSLDERRIVLVHEPDVVEALAGCGDYDLVVYGHTHRAEVRRKDGTVVVNPGKAAKLHRGASTAALLDTVSMKVEIVDLL